MKHRLWDTNINRLFGTFDTEDDALALVRTFLKSYEDAYANDLALGCDRQDGSFTAPLTGAALVERPANPTGARVGVRPHAGRSGSSHW